MENKVISKEYVDKVEIWKDIKDYEGLYQVSNLGNVRSLDMIIMQLHYWSKKYVKHIYKGRLLKGSKNSNGYKVITLHKGKKTEKKLLHKIIAETFIPNPNNYNYINHKDNNPSNNNVNNLEWCTQSYNIKYAYEKGNKTQQKKKKINQIKNGNILKTFISISDAERKTGIKGANISKCCRNLRNYAGGYQWEYVK